MLTIVNVVIIFWLFQGFKGTEKTEQEQRGRHPVLQVRPSGQGWPGHERLPEAVPSLCC